MATWHEQHGADHPASFQLRAKPRFCGVYSLLVCVLLVYCAETLLGISRTEKFHIGTAAKRRDVAARNRQAFNAFLLLPARLRLNSALQTYYLLSNFSIIFSGILPVGISERYGQHCVCITVHVALWFEHFQKFLGRLPTYPLLPSARTTLLPHATLSYGGGGTCCGFLTAFSSPEPPPPLSSSGHCVTCRLPLHTAAWRHHTCVPSGVLWINFGWDWMEDRTGQVADWRTGTDSGGQERGWFFLPCSLFSWNDSLLPSPSPNPYHFCARHLPTHFPDSTQPHTFTCLPHYSMPSPPPFPTLPKLWQACSILLHACHPTTPHCILLFYYHPIPPPNHTLLSAFPLSPSSLRLTGVPWVQWGRQIMAWPS